MMLKKLLTIGILLALTHVGCIRTGSTNVQNSNSEQEAKPPKKLTVFLVDRSGSFHKIQKQGNFEGQDYFHIACDQIKQYVEEQAGKEDELILVRIIESSSFSDDTFIAKVDFTGQFSAFSEPKPQGPLREKDREEWQKRKDKFEEDVKNKRGDLIKDFLTRIDNLKRMKASDETDVVNAFRALLPELKAYPDYSKRLIVYSDFKDTQTKVESAGEIDLGSETEVEGRFVSMNELNPNSYEALKAAWRKLLKCKALKFKTPAESS